VEVPTTLRSSPNPIVFLLLGGFGQHDDRAPRPTAADLSQAAASGPHYYREYGESGVVVPDLALSDADADAYSTIVFVGGWGASSYQYAYEGTY
jgi:hypothetical protein